VDDVYETHLAADFPVVAADGGEREVDAVRQSRAVDEDVAQLLLLRAKQGKVFAEELALGVFVPDGDLAICARTVILCFCGFMASPVDAWSASIKMS